MASPTRSAVLVLSTVPPTHRLDALLGDLHARRTKVRWGYLGEHPAPTVSQVHQLRVRTGRRDVRDAVLAAAGRILTRPWRAVLAAKFDPWVKRAARSSDLVVALDEAAESALRIIEVLAPGTPVAGPRSAATVLGGWLADQRLRDAVGACHVPGRDGSGRASLRPLLDEFHALAAEGLPAPQDHGALEELLESLTRARAHQAVLEVSDGCAAVPELRQDPAVVGYRTLAELNAQAETAADIHSVARGVLARADDALHRDDEERAAVRTALAMDLLFHRELHSDQLSSALVDRPDATLSVLRSSTVGRLLTTSSSRLQPAERHRAPLRVTVLPGPFGSFEAPMVDALDEFPDARVTVVDMRGTFPGFRSMAIDPSLVEERLRAALGRPTTRFARAADLLRDPDVIVADWAGKAALVASLHSPPHVRLVLRVHSVDLLRPWVHLVDWGRVDEVICVSAACAGLLRDLLGERITGDRVHLVPPLIDLARFDQPRTEDSGRTLCMVGWAQRVKDPLWALEVFAQLVSADDSWRLLLIGADFATNPTASGRAYAEAFRARAMADDVRERITYVGFTTDLPRHLRQAAFVLSASRREGFPVGLAEAVAAGAVPVVRDWPMLSRRAATAMYPDEWVVQTVEGAVARIRSLAEPQHRRSAARRARHTIATLADPDSAADELRSLVLGEPARLADLVRRGEDERARQHIADVLARPEPDLLLLRSASRAAHTIGAMTQRVEVLRRLLEVRPDAATKRMLRAQIGRLRETSATWTPKVPAPDEPLQRRDGRILHILKNSRPTRQSGYTMRSWYTLAEQRRLGLDAIGVTALDFPDATGQPAPAAMDDVDGVPHYRLLRPEVPDREPVDVYLTAWAEALAALVADLQPSVLHVHSGHRGYESALVALSVGQAFNVPVVYEVRGFFESLWRADPLRAERGETYHRRRATEARCMQAASAVVTLSESMRADILERGVREDKVSVIPNAVDPDAFPLRERCRTLVEQYGLTGRFVFGYVSNLDHAREGHELLIHAAVALREAGIPATALIVGDGRRRAELEALADQLGGTDVVLFTGSIPHVDVQDYYRLCDVFVIPRIPERAARLVTPLKPYEAMALGIPLLVSDVEALLEVIGHGARGTSFRAGESSSLVEALKRAHDHPEELAAKAVAAREWVCHTRTWASNAVRYRELYRRLPVPTRRSTADAERSTP